MHASCVILKAIVIGVEGVLVKHSIVTSANMQACTAPVHSREAVLSRIAKRAVDGKVCVLEHASKQPLIVTVHPEGDAVTCQTMSPEDDSEQEEQE